jgi:alpha-beta hydrolase superfamily lysophospholipase
VIAQLVWWVLAGVGCSFLGWTVFSVRRVLFPEPYRIPAPDPLPAYTTHVLEASDGTTFDVWLLDAAAPRARLLICHGYLADRFQVLGLADGLRRLGYETVLFELRGHGGRPGPCTLGARECDDARAVLRWAKMRGSSSSSLPVGVVGFSMGAVVACLTAFHEPEITAVIADSAYARFFPVLRRAIWQRYHVPAIPLVWLTWWALQLALRRRLARIDPGALAPQLRQPLLAIQGGADQRVVPALSQAFYERWGGPKERWFEPDTVHVGMFAKDPKGYCRRVASFLDRVLAAP